MPSPPENETVMEPHVIITDNALKVDVCAIAGVIPVVAVSQVATDNSTSWFRRPVSYGVLHKVDGGWTRAVHVLTTSKAHVDSVCPIAESAYVYYDDDVYDSTLIEKRSGLTYVTQLIFDSETSMYYVYYRWGETDYKLDGPHGTIESAKEAFQVTYKEKFDVEWTDRETTTSERWTYVVRIYETLEKIEEIKEVIEETAAEIIFARDHETIEKDNDAFVLEKRPPAEGKIGGSAGLSSSALAAMIGAS
ncbi:hypothetical protein BGZ70_002271 [Mortierella alpina]|uniref:Uncharacterized protein n=1 Tax=Mortierella alpina TaxID=64518 RepID=A0A9P6IUF4_MORAP|nr:hypothetical protein BGZ70_002271 [Mortierella alpina]